MFTFGTFSSPHQQLSKDQVTSLLSEAHRRKAAFARVPIERIVNALGRVAELWQPGSKYQSEALKIVAGEVPFSESMIAMSLGLIPQLLSRQAIERRLRSEFGRLTYLDHFERTERFAGRERAFPLGVVLHVSAGNVFLGTIDSLLMGFLTKNISLVKMSSKNQGFPDLFARSVAEADSEGILTSAFALLSFPGGSDDIETELKQSVNAVIAWGGEDMVMSYRRNLPAGTKFLEYGPKISFQVISRAALKTHNLADIARDVARDIAIWDQAACASPQNLFIEDGIDGVLLAKHIAQALEASPWPRGELSADEDVELLKEEYRAQFHTFVPPQRGAYVRGKSSFIHVDPTPGLRPSPLNRTLIVKSFRNLDDLIAQVAPFARHLQSCGYLLDETERDGYLNALGAAGVMRFAHLGHVMEAPVGAPHDGRMGLAELTRLVPDEKNTDVMSFVASALERVPFYRDRGPHRATQLTDVPMLTGQDLQAHPLGKSRAFLDPSVNDLSEGGYTFSSGGTSGAPKFTFYTHAEFQEVAQLLALGFQAQGLKRGDRVANLFMAGNMWSSFLAVDHAMAHIGASVLPIGGAAEPEIVLQYLTLFPCRAIVGLPTQLIALARHAQGREAPRVPLLFYAGEHLSQPARQLLRKVFHVEHFGSAGYASVDAGPVGYQCLSCEGGTHHLFSQHVHLEIIDGEGVVTSLVKEAMPIVRLRTGDLVRWCDGACTCGSSDPRFVLLGRRGSQFNLWGCRMFLEDVEKSLADLDIGGAVFQVVLRNDADAREHLYVTIEVTDPQLALPMSEMEEKFRDFLYQHSQDLQHTQPRQSLNKQCHIRFAAENTIPRHQRTGKVTVVVDER